VSGVTVTFAVALTVTANVAVVSDAVLGVNDKSSDGANLEVVRVAVSGVTVT
jgi:hypothetical protein